jgi:hypothetical protein
MADRTPTPRHLTAEQAGAELILVDRIKALRDDVNAILDGSWWPPASPSWPSTSGIGPRQGMVRKLRDLLDAAELDARTADLLAEEVTP